MAVMMRNRSFKDRLGYYVSGQASSVPEYLLQGAVTTLLAHIPGFIGFGLRGLGYRLIMRIDGVPAIEPHVRLRHARSIHLAKGVYLDQGVYLHGCPSGISIGADTCVMHNTELHVFNFRDLPHAFISVGRDCFIGESVVIRGQGGVTIGDSVLIGPQVKILAVEHVFGDVGRPVIQQGIEGRGIVIGDGAWIGAGAAVLDGTHIGAGAVIGANAVVNRDIPAHTVAVGMPARVVRDFSHAPMELNEQMLSLSRSGLGDALNGSRHLP